MSISRQTGLPTSFEIIISEEQRVALIAALKTAGVGGDSGPLEFWLEMLDGLPADELESPGASHGFCL
jgi:hypothetical protein